MPFIFQPLSDYGTSTPAVARTTLQCRDIFQLTSLSDVQREVVLTTAFELERHLVRCVEQRDAIEQQVQAGWQQINAKGVKGQGAAYQLPGVTDLHAKCESFLHSARLGLHQCGKLVTAALRERYGKKAPDKGHQFHELAKWAAGALGDDHEFTTIVRNSEPWVKRVVTMRNCVDHPKEGPGGALFTRDFSLRPGPMKLQVMPPSWGLTGEEPADLLHGMCAIIDGIIEVQEDLVAGLFGMLKAHPHLELYEKPIAERDPANPRRLFVTIRGLPAA